MEYYSTDQLYKYFETEIQTSATKRMTKLKKEIADLKEQAIASINDQLKESIQLQLKTELKDLKTDHSYDINKIMTENGRILMKRRQELLDSVFSEASDKLIEFSKTDAYMDLMNSKIKNALELFKSFEVVFQVKKGDSLLMKVIQNVDSKKHKIEETTSIKLGGFLVTCREKGIEIDETIDLKLTEKKQWFYANSNLFVKH